MEEFDPSTVNYHLTAVTDGGTYEIQDRIDGLTWSEGSGEYASTISFTVINQPASESDPATQTGHFMHEFLKLGMLIVVSAKSNIKDEEVARGFILDWKTSSSASEQSVSIKCYDQLYALRKSQVNMYFPEGTMTKTIYDEIINELGITAGEYQGPNVSNAKTPLRSTGAEKAIQDLFDYARKQGGRALLCSGPERPRLCVSVRIQQDGLGSPAAPHRKGHQRAQHPRHDYAREDHRPVRQGRARAGRVHKDGRHPVRDPAEDHHAVKRRQGKQGGNGSGKDDEG